MRYADMAVPKRDKTALPNVTKAPETVCRLKPKQATSAVVAATSPSKTNKVKGCPQKVGETAETVIRNAAYAETCAATALTEKALPKAEICEVGLDFSLVVLDEAIRTFCTKKRNVHHFANFFMSKYIKMRQSPADFCLIMSQNCVLTVV